MPASIGVNLRVTGHCSQGGRKYMEDLFSVAYQQTEDERDLEYAFFGIYDGHGGSEAAAFAKEHLMDSIVKQRQFWSDNDEDVLKAIRNGYMLTHLNMWKELEKWPKTVTGLPSTAGTTASVAFIRRGKIYIGHVGDSAIILGYQKDDCEEWAAKPLTSDHKPESTSEIERIQRCGGKVVSKAGVPRVVWNRPRPGHKGPIKKNTLMDEIPFLAVARSLGDLWSYNAQNDEFIVSPDPDVGVLTIDPSKFRCLIFGTDGLWNMISPEGAVSLVQATEKHNEAALVGCNSAQPRDWLNPSKSLVDHALERWSNTRMRADNTSVVTLMLDPPGPPRATVLRSRTGPQRIAPQAPAAVPPDPAPAVPADARPVPQNGLTIMTRYSDTERALAAPAPVPAPAPAPAAAPAAAAAAAAASESTPLPPCTTLDARLSVAPLPDDALPSDATILDDADTLNTYGNPAESYFMARLLNRTRLVNSLAAVPDEILRAGRSETEPEEPQQPTTQVTELTEPVEPDVHDSVPTVPITEIARPDAAGDRVVADDGGIQINEVSSSSPTEAPPRPRGRRPRSEQRREEPAAVNDRVLRSHHEPDVPPRPNTRQSVSRSRLPASPAPDRIVILNRRATPQPATPERRQTPAPKQVAPDTPSEDEENRRSARATRSQSAAATPLAQKITRSIGAYARDIRGATGAVAAAAVATGGGARAGNSSRAPGPARRAPAARRQGARSKENLGGERGRARARVASAGLSAQCPHRPRSRPHRADNAHDESEVHSTTVDHPPAACLPAPPVRALRSRNEATPPVVPRDAPPCKRARKSDELEPAATKVTKLAVEKCARALGKRASGPWAPSLALRNRLRRRLVK